MTDSRERVALGKLATGVPGLDDVLGGGLPEYSFNLIVGGPGGGKTTLAHQILFANSSQDRPAVYFTILGEPPLKMLRYQQQFSFFDAGKVNGAIRFVSLSQEATQQGDLQLLESIVRQVEAAEPGLVVVDSFHSVMRSVGAGQRDLELRDFIQRLALHLAAWQATTFLVGEFDESETHVHPVYTIADSILLLSQRVEHNSVVRKLRVVKMRGQSEWPGLHSFRITGDGLRVFPRLPKPEEEPQKDVSQTSAPVPDRVSTGVSGLDEMLDGGIPSCYSWLIAGPSGSGKSVLAAQFIADGVKRGEPGVIAVFEKSPSGYLESTVLGRDLSAMARAGQLSILYLRPLDLSVDETLYELRETVKRLRAKRVAIDSLSGFEIAVSPGFRADFRESLYRLVGSLTGLGVTVAMTLEIEDSYTELRLGPGENAFLADAIVLQRYVELEGELKRIISVVKVRASQHSKELRLYEISSAGLAVGPKVAVYPGFLTGNPRREPGRTPRRGRTEGTGQLQEE